MKLDAFIVHFKHSYHFKPVSCAIWFNQRADIHSAFEDKAFLFHAPSGKILLKCLSIRRSQERIWTDLQFYSNIGPLDKKTPLCKIWFELSIVHCPCGHGLSFSWQQNLDDCFLPGGTSGESGRRNVEHHADEGKKIKHMNHRWNNLPRRAGLWYT